MSVGLDPPDALSPVPGIRLATAAAGIRRADVDDVALIEICPNATTAAVFTQNRFRAAPILVARDHIAKTQPRALLINSGCANAGTGSQGYTDAHHICAEVAQALDIEPEQVLPFSTGVIGERLPVDAMRAAARGCVSQLAATNWLAAARSIMTTDTVPKGVSRTFLLNGQEITVTGIAKGAGMIEPNMATMLALVACDAPVALPALRGCLQRAVTGSFNCISVDGDTSTNDACVLVATGEASVPKLETLDDKRAEVLNDAVSEVTHHLAQSIVRDAEGATKFVTVHVANGANVSDCKEIAYTVARSPLVKTALFASDPNWGRILAAVGRAELTALDMSRVSLKINGTPVFTGGEIDPRYREPDGARAMQAPEIELQIDLAVGTAHATVWTSDLSHDYVRINAEYRT